ncbi:hypothetical protein I8F73_00520 [Enterococcus faecalis]|nr:hypothetical protein [Enterococcus faecalis]
MKSEKKTKLLEEMYGTFWNKEERNGPFYSVSEKNLDTTSLFADLY